MDQLLFQTELDQLCYQTLSQLGPGWQLNEGKAWALNTCAQYVDQLCLDLEENLSNPAVKVYTNTHDLTLIIGITCEDASIYGRNDPFLNLARRFNAIQCVKLANDLMELRFILENVWVKVDNLKPQGRTVNVPPI
jgi:hypothetical protein